MNKTYPSLVLLALVVSLGTTAHGAPVVDGNLAEWGIGMQGGHNTYDALYGVSYPMASNGGVAGTITSGLPIGLPVDFHVEDSNDSSGIDYRVGPLYGGQDFDAEFLGVAHDPLGNKLWIAISTGQRSDNAFAYFEPGDILIQTVHGTYYGVETWGKTFNLDSLGHVTSVVDGFQQGSLVETSGTGDWLGGISGSNNPTTQVVGGTVVGTTDFVYHEAGLVGGTQHAWIEAGIDLSLFDSAPSLVRWAPSCGNDELEIEVTITPLSPPPIPEASAMVTWSLLLGCGFAAAWWRKRRSV
jgi:hypothetical protein